MPESNAIMLRLPPDLLAWVEKQAKKQKKNRQAIINAIIAERMILGDKTK